ncbi:MAG: hypothetical protein KTR33_07220 [Gammaproteobacteria bacterium]|nr:hypothetical protein [Gammaproteobacteria bacterium]
MRKLTAWRSGLARLNQRHHPHRLLSVWRGANAPAGAVTDDQPGRAHRLADRIIISNGIDLAVALQVESVPKLTSQVVAKVRGAPAVAAFVSNAENLYQCVYNQPGLTRLLFESVPLLQTLSDDLQLELERMRSSVS